MWAVCPQPLVVWVDGDNLSPSFIVNIVNVFQGLLSGCWVLLCGGSERIRTTLLSLPSSQNRLKTFYGLLCLAFFFLSYY